MLLPTLHVAKLSALHWGIVRGLEQRRLQDQLEALPRPEPRRLVMDEFALCKGHRYAGVMLSAEIRCVMWIGEDHSRGAIRPFFDALWLSGWIRIKTVAINLNSAFDLKVRHTPPTPRTVYLFHLVAKYGREMID